MSVSYYGQLDVENRKSVHKAACQPFQGRITPVQFKTAIDVLLKGHIAPDDDVIRQLIEAIENKASEHVKQTHVTSWKGVCNYVWDLSDLCQIASSRFTITCAVSAGLSLFYLRSHRIIAVACGCVAVAAFSLRTTALHCAAAASKYGQAIDNLTIFNDGQFYDQLTAVYEEHKKTDFLARAYFHRQERALGKTEVASQLLNEQLTALRQMRRLWLHLMASQSFALDEKINAQPAEVKNFFGRFESITRRSLLYGAGFTFGSMGWTAYTFAQRAYLMSVAGIVSITVGTVISYQLYLFNQGAKKIHIVSDESVPSAFQDMVSKIFLLRRLGLQKAELKQIHQAFVIPCDEILKLIPSWNGVK